jgi:hypothetical protein
MRPRTWIGLAFVVHSVIASVFFLSVFLRVGFPQWQDGAKGVIYLWAVIIIILLPLTTGIALIAGMRTWLPFIGRWLLAISVFALGSLFWFLPPYQGWPLTLGVGFVVCVLPPMACGLYLLRTKS